MVGVAGKSQACNTCRERRLKVSEWAHLSHDSPRYANTVADSRSATCGDPSAGNASRRRDSARDMTVGSGSL